MERMKSSGRKSDFLRSGALLISAAAALCLFLEPSKYTLALEALIFLATALTLWVEGPKRRQKLSPCAVLMAAVFTAVGILTFTSAWSRSGILGAVAGLVGLPVTALALVISLAGGIVGFHAFYCLACRFEDALESLLPAGGSLRENLSRNWYFPLSAAAFLCVQTSFQSSYHLTVPTAAAAAVTVACHAGDLKKLALSAGKAERMLAGVTGAALCMSLPHIARLNWAVHTGGEMGAIGMAAALFATVLSVPFVLLCLTAFWQELARGLRRALEGVTRAELIAAGAVFVLLLALCAVNFLRSDAFYGTPYSYDILYTSDSPMLVKENVYMTLANGENDLRQPLFALFAMPFTALPTLVSRVTGAGPAANALLLNSVQLAVLVAANLMVAVMTDLTPWKRLGFFLVLTACYPTLLFSVMMEQYIFAYFYLVLFLALYSRGERDRFAFWGAGGTLLTSLVLVTAMDASHPVRAFRIWFSRMLSLGMTFLALLLLLGRVEVILEFSAAMEKMGSFAGQELTLAQKLMQYSVFLGSCLTAPAAEAVENIWGQPSWQLLMPERFSLFGIGVLVLCLLGAVLDRKRMATRIAALWLAFSVVILVVLGWGTQENGLILYALYFGWTVPVLLLGLVRSLKLPLGDKAAGTAAVLAAGTLAAVNLTGLGRLVAFALEQYPL